MDELLLGRIFLGRLKPSLSQPDKALDLRTTIGPTLSLSHFVEREEEPDPLPENDNEMYFSWEW